MTGRTRSRRPGTFGVLLLFPVLALPACGPEGSRSGPGEGGPELGSTPAERVSPPDAPAPQSAAALVEAGIDAYYAADFEEAVRLLRAARARAREEEDSWSEARSRIWQAQAARQQGDLLEGRRHARTALEMVLHEGLTALEPQAYSTLGFLAWYQNRLGEAAGLFERSLERARELRDPEGISRAANNLALIHREWGEFDRAREGFEATLQAGRAMGDAYHEAIALVNLGMLDIELGDAPSAIPRLEEARRLFVEHGFPDWESYPLSHLGAAHLQLGELGKARESVQRALALARTHGLVAEEAEELRLLAELHRRAEDYPRALELYGEAARIESELGGVQATGSDLRNIAEIHAAVEDLETAAARASEALRLHGEVGARHEELMDRVVLSEISFLRGLPEEARAHLEAARSLAQTLGTRAARVRVSLAEARIADAAGDAAGVHRALAGVDGDLHRGGFAAEWEASRLRARAFTREGRPDSAVVWARRAVATVEGVRERLGAGVLGTTYAGARGDTYWELASVLLRLGRVEEAFQVADAARGGALRELLPAAAGSAPTLDPAVAALLEAEELLPRIHRLAASLDSLEITPPNLRDEAFHATARDLAGRLARARQEYVEQMEGLTARRAGISLLGGGAVEVQEVREALHPGELLVEYLVGSEGVLIFAVSPDGLHVAEAGVNARNLASRVRLALALLRDPARGGEGAASTVLGRLHEALIGPLSTTGVLAGAERLVVVPHGVLAYLPFAALRDPLTGRYLGQDQAILHVPSAAVLIQLRLEEAGPYSRDTGLRAFAPFPGELPASRREVEALARTQGARSDLGPAAREREVRRALESGDMVHIASHAVMNARNPFFSRIELAAPGEPRGGSGTEEVGSGGQGRVDSRDDGRLEVHELLGIRVRAPLVFLSGCETGLGSAWSTDFTPGEDYVTLDRAFLYAGARNVVATLWRVEDEGAAEFAEAFYRELRNAPPAEALARAQRTLLDRGGESAAPFRWAAYRVSGAGP